MLTTLFAQTTPAASGSTTPGSTTPPSTAETPGIAETITERGRAIAEEGQAMAEQVGADTGKIFDSFAANLPTLLGALAILVFGWLAAVVVAAGVRMAMRRTGLDRRLAEWCVGEETKAPKVERGVAKGIYYLLLILVLVAFFDMLGLAQVTTSLNSLLSEILTYAPRILGAGVLIFAAWVVATTTRFVVRRVTTAMKLDETLSSQAALTEGRAVEFSKTASNATYWLVFLLFLPAILNALALPGLLAPVQEMVAKILGFLPNLFAAGLILAVGWLAARVVQRITTNVAVALGTDNLAERIGLSAAMGQRRLSNLLGTVVYVLVLLPVLVAGLNALQLEAVTGPASQMLTMVLETVPAIFAAIVVVSIAYVVGRMVAGLCTNLLTGIGFDTLPAKLGLRKEENFPAGHTTPSQMAGRLVLVATMLFAVMQALPILGFTLLAGLISDFLVFAGHLLMGLVIFGIGLYLANLAAQVVQTSGVTQANLLAIASRVSIIILAGAVGLRHMGLANEIITSAFTILMGAIGVAIALAFGLGGRDAAGRALEHFLESRRAEAEAAAAQRATTAQAPIPPGAPVQMPPQPGAQSFSGPEHV